MIETFLTGLAIGAALSLALGAGFGGIILYMNKIVYPAADYVSERLGLGYAVGGVVVGMGAAFPMITAAAILFEVAP